MTSTLRFCAAAVLIAAASCGTKPVSPTFATLETDTTLRCGPVEYNVRYRFVTLANAAESPSLQAIEEAGIHYFFGLEGFTGSAEEAVAVALERICRETQADLRFEAAANPSAVPVREYSECAVAEVAVIDTLIVYTIHTSGYAGGAHGMYSTSAHNFSLVGGYELTLRDLFTPAQLGTLDTLIRNRLYDRYGVAGDEGLAEQGFFPECIAPTENFAVTETGITFYFNPYDIGCYALGDVSVEIGSQELQSLRSRR